MFTPNQIAKLMLEESGIAQPIPIMTSISSISSDCCDDGTCDDADHIGSDQLKIAKNFVELMGGIDKARLALDKIEECGDCIDLLDDDGPQIEQMASLLPFAPDLPMGVASVQAL